jgi:hypothetical protein
MFDSALLDVAIGMLLLFLVASLIASAVVEVIGGFLHRRAKHLWDTLDLLLGNTSTTTGGVRSIVDELYKQPFITGLVRPTDRVMFDPASTEEPKRVPLRASPPKRVRQRALVATRALEPAELRRRFYGPIHLDSREFTNALLALMRPQGRLDQALDALRMVREQIAETPSDTDIALADVEVSLTELETAARELRAADIADAIDAIKQAGAAVDSERLKSLLSDAESALIGLFTGDPTREEILAAIGLVPKDLRKKLLAVLSEAGESITEIRAGVEDWYDRNMEAASSWYRKQTRWFLFLAGLVMAISLNVDAVHATSTLYRDESTRMALVGLAEQVSQVDCAATADGSADAASDTETETDTETATEDETDGDTASAVDLDCVRDAVGGSLPFPVGWSDVDTSARGWGLRALGWVFIAGSVTLGAPFWFDLLGRALRLRKKPATTSTT